MTSHLTQQKIILFVIRKNRLFYMLRPLLLVLILSLITAFSSRQGQTPEVCLSADEKKLLELINEYRKKNKLPVIEVSASLSYVAQIHAKDLAENNPDKSNCNMHSWSDKGTWSSCCYTPDHKQAKCMWGKPSELTTYKSNGYEISTMTSAVKLSPEDALNSWKGSKPHNQTILSQYIWKKYPWKAVGIGMYKNYATVWFGTEQDPAGKPEFCK